MIENVCNENYLYESELNYMLGVLAGSNIGLNLKPQIEYFEKAFELLQEKNIHELTWRVLLKLSQVYFNRGDINKAKLLSHYGKELINHITEKIRNEKIRNSYLEQKKVAGAIKIFNNIERMNNI